MIRVRFACLCLPVVALMGTAPPASCQAPARPFEPVGRWRFFHDNGAPFTARLAPDQSAATDSGRRRTRHLALGGQQCPRDLHGWLGRPPVTRSRRKVRQARLGSGQ